jgi:hypothetical protein
VEREVGEGLLRELLARQGNGFEAVEWLTDRLDGSLMEWSELVSFRQRNAPGRRLSRRTLRHAFLLPDGSSHSLWEIEHNTGADADEHAPPRYELYADRESMLRAQYAIDGWFGVPEPPGPEDFAEALTLGPEPMPIPSPRRFSESDSAEHAWRLLRRAENGDVPGEPVRRLLMSAIGHDIRYVTGRESRFGDRIAGWTLYEHAFLLASGDELSLWEVEHTMTPDGRPMCEVYEDERAACDAAELRLDAG